MKSTAAVTYEMDDMEKAAEELASETLRGLPLFPHPVGLLFCDFEMDHVSLMAALKKKFPPDFELAGCTTVGTINGKDGLRNMAATLTVMTADDVRFSLAVSDVVTPDNAVLQIEKSYRAAAESLGVPVELALAFPCQNGNVMLDEYPETLGRISGSVPLFGGLPTAVPSPGKVFFNGASYVDRSIFVLIGGNVRPVFSVGNVVSHLTGQKLPITRAERNTIYEVGDVTLVEYLRRRGIPVEKIAADPKTTAFASNPLLLEIPGGNDDGVPFVRVLQAIDLKEGSGRAGGKTPQGAMFSVANMNRQDIDISARQALLELTRQMESNAREGYVYSTVLCVSCVARYIVMAGNRDAEGKAVAAGTDRNLNLSGFYGYGELCPTSMRNGRANNRAHNESIVFCAL